MITTGFNPYSRVQNTPQRQNVAFQRRFEKSEIQDLLDGEDSTYNDVRDLICLNVIKTKDGALEQIQAVHQQNTDPDLDGWFKKIVELLKNQK